MRTLIALLVSAGFVAAEPVITGTVVDEQGKIVRDGRVEIQAVCPGTDKAASLAVYSDADGRFRCPLILMGEHCPNSARVSLWIAHSRNVKRRIVIEADATKSHDVGNVVVPR